MRKFLGSLQFRLIIGFAAVLLLALGSVAVYTRFAAANAIERFENEVIAVREERLETMIQTLLLSGLRGPQLEQFLEQAGSLYGLRIAVADEEGQIISETLVAPEYAFFGDQHQREDLIRVFLKTDRKAGRPNVVRPKPKTALLPLREGNIHLGAIAFTDAGADAFIRPEPRGITFIANVNSFLLWAGLGAGAVAIVISIFVSRRTLSPLRSLQHAAERLGAGDLGQRVDITRNDEVGEMAHTFNAMAAELEQAEARRRVLMADVAHELRTPLANIQGYVEAIRDEVVEADESTMSTLHQQVLHLTHLIDDLRLLALAEAGVLPLDPQPTSLIDVVRASIDAFRPRADDKQITLSLAGPETLPVISIDKERIAQVLSNLLENAIQHTPEHGTVAIAIEATASVARVSIADTGLGIPPEELHRVFERFYRRDPSRSRATGGAGLGLTIAKQLVEAHQGTLGANSNAEGGSTFTFSLPINR